MRYWVRAETPPQSPCERPAEVRGAVHYRDDAGETWGCRFRAEIDTLDPREALGLLEFFSPEAPALTRNQRLELYAGRQLVLVCDVLGAG